MTFIPDFSKLSAYEWELLDRIVDRVKREGIAYNLYGNDISSLMTDIAVVHVYHGGLELAEMLTCSKGDLGHDLAGIYNCLNRATGEMDDGFVPRLCLKRHVCRKKEANDG